MPRLLFLNIEEVVSDHNLQTLLRYYPQRYLLRANPGDIVVVPDPVPGDFLDYAKRLKKLPHEKDWLVVSGRNRGKYCAVASLLQNRRELARLKTLLGRGGYVFVPYMQTPKALALAQKLGLPAASSGRKALESGLAAAVNNKIYFKRFCRGSGVPVLPDYACATRAQLLEAIARLGAGGKRLILKKACSGGGYGNLSGGAQYLRRKTRSWYQGGDVLAEPHLAGEKVVGSLALMSDKGCRLLGLDLQVCENDAWRGCIYPYRGGGAAPIARHTLALARKLRKLGLRGELNLDWLDTKNGVFAMECNFRDNGFGHALELGRDVFGLAPRKIFVRYYAALKLGRPSRTLPQVLKKLSALNAGLKKGGAVLCGKPHAAKTDLLLCSDSAKGLKRLDAAAMRALS